MNQFTSSAVFWRYTCISDTFPFKNKKRKHYKNLNKYFKWWTSWRYFFLYHDKKFHDKERDLYLESCRPCCPCRIPPRSPGSPPYPPDSEETVPWFWETSGATSPCIFLGSSELVPCSWRLPANLSGAPAGEIFLNRNKTGTCRNKMCL